MLCAFDVFFFQVNHVSSASCLQRTSLLRKVIWILCVSNEHVYFERFSCKSETAKFHANKQQRNNLLGFFLRRNYTQSAKAIYVGIGMKKKILRGMLRVMMSNGQNFGHFNRNIVIVYYNVRFIIQLLWTYTFIGNNFFWENIK